MSIETSAEAASLRQASSPAGELAGPASATTTRTPASAGPEGRSPAVSATPPPAVPDTGAPSLSPAEALTQLLRELLALERPLGLAAWRGWAERWLAGEREHALAFYAELGARGWTEGVEDAAGFSDALVPLGRACTLAAVAATSHGIAPVTTGTALDLAAQRLAQYRERCAKERAS